MSTEEFFIPPEVPDTPSTSRFPVRTQLAVLGGLLFILLGAALIPIFIGPKEDASTLVDTVASVTDTNNFQNTTVLSLGDLSVGAQSVYVYDVVGKRALYNKNANTVLPLASITKLMTTLVAHELMTDDTSIIIPTAAVRQDGASGLREGDSFASGSLIDYAMQASSNDAAYALAVAAGSLLDEDYPADRFVTSMNLKAEELGLTGMIFYNPTGLDISPTEAGAYGSARDVTFLMEYILKNYPQLLAETTEATNRVYNDDGVYYEAENTNPAIANIPNLLGSKTGYTDLAGGNLTVAFDAGFNRPIIITVLGSTYSDRFSDVETLAEAVQAAFSTTQ